MLSVSVRKSLGDFAIDAAFDCGGATALFGPSGSGKTSIINMIAGLMTPDRGRIVLDGDVLFDDAARANVPPWQRRIGTVFQEGRLFPHFSVKRNLDYGRWMSGLAADPTSFAHAVELLDIGHLLDRRPGKLSGGERQRVAIGRALLMKPRLLLLDEPLAALDEKRKAEILPFLERVRSSLSIPTIFVSHNVDEVVRLANRVAVIAQGRIRRVGSIFEVFADLGLGDILDGGAAGAAIPARVSVEDDGSGLSVLDFAGGQFRVPGAGRPAGTAINLRIRARDVALARNRVDGISILNQFQGRITEIASGEGPYADVLVDIGVPVWARISRHSLKDLGLSVGQRAWCLVKAVSFDTDPGKQ